MGSVGRGDPATTNLEKTVLVLTQDTSPPDPSERLPSFLANKFFFSSQI